MIILFLLLFAAEAVMAQSENERKWTIGLFGGLYFMQDEAFQDLYGKSAFFLGAEIPFFLPLKSIKNVEGLLHFRYLNDKGKTSLTEEEIKLQLIWLSFSLRYAMNFNKFRPFLGLGIDYLLYQEKYPETFPVDSMKGSTLGWHILGGSYYSFSSFLSAKIYFKYNLAKATEEGVKVNLGGTEWGIGLLYRFNL